ncbi:nuclear transport factor 2 family protein [Roseisolibacter sp. H3M3-2]|uniref:nuclear transport factor 2 family protein n=1 Tax=Roseisolibacter sp. H3M3-2 TaxID=3031323 RepID=UPI0023DCE9A3|nr:nuclear transport factor 2 family protein [Roseisolibacter sp. H3M3-2]MDF1504924.1 nuclear transport factor 2 family protein [Roseisolibacter sp. H3M3-2]
MRRLASLLAAAAATAAPLAAQAPADNAADPELPAIRRALDHYLAGHATGDGAHFRAAFHPVANLYFVRGDTVATRTGAEYIAGASGKPAADEAQRRRRIVFIDRTGDAATAKIELDYPSATLTDYMTLLKTGGEWKVVNKIFHSAPKAAR